MAHLDRGDAKIYYEVHGAGPTILMCHGFGGSSQLWKGQLEALTQQHQVIVWDMRGHSRTQSPTDPALYEEDRSVEDMKALLDHCGADKAIIGGHSMGGYMALAFYLEYPERVHALMMIDTGPGFKKDDARDQWNARANRTADRLEEKGIEVLAKSPEAGSANHQDAQALAHAARGMFARKDARVISAMGEVKVPTWICVGEHDKAFSAAGDYMAAKIGGAQKTEIADAGHHPNLDQPAAFNSAMIEFLGGLA
jgi:pimeloyl-ACP methyl ester carboxylesterase